MEIEEKISEKKKILFLIHEHADPDAVGSAYYLSRCCGGDIASPSVPSMAGKNLLSFLDFDLKDSIDLESYDLFVVVDTPDKSQLEPFDFPLEKTVVIDHHSGNSWEKWGDVEIYLEDRISCSEMVYEMIGPKNLSIKEGIALASGIFTDSSSLQRADHRTLRILSQILEKSEVSIERVKQVLFESRSYSEKMARLKGAVRAELQDVNGFILAKTTIGAFESSVASFLISGGADIVLVVNPSSKEERSRITSRAVEEITGKGIDLGKLFKEIAEGEEDLDGGGHPGAAVLNVVGSPDDHLRSINERIISQMIEKGLGRAKD
ncbi:MAG: DHH family phosphoesterase [Candidatus Aenigmatarchaeota archaeon]